MKVEQLPASLLNGEYLHCRPVRGGQIVTARIVPSDIELTPGFKVAIMCPERRPSSKCELRVKTDSQRYKCRYWKGDSRGEYQIIGPGMDKKSNGDWE